MELHLEKFYRYRCNVKLGKTVGKLSRLRLTIIPRARMGFVRDHEGERNNCVSKIQLVGKKYRDKTTLASKTRFSRHCIGFQGRHFSLLVGYNI